MNGWGMAMRGRLSVHSAATVVLVVVALVVTACGASQLRVGPPPQVDMAEQALQFGGVVLPASAAVLGVESEHRMDRLYTVAVEVQRGTVEQILSDSRFDTPLEPGRRVFMPPLTGYEIGDPEVIASAQDRLPPDGDRTVTVFREILVDYSDPAKPVMHLWLFTT